MVLSYFNTISLRENPQKPLVNVQITFPWWIYVKLIVLDYWLLFDIWFDASFELRLDVVQWSMAKPQHRFTQDSIYSASKNWSPSVCWLSLNRLFEYWNICTKLISFIKIKKKLVIISGINLIRNRIDRIYIRQSARFFFHFEKRSLYMSFLTSWLFIELCCLHLDFETDYWSISIRRTAFLLTKTLLYSQTTLHLSFVIYSPQMSATLIWIVIYECLDIVVTCKLKKITLSFKDWADKP